MPHAKWADTRCLVVKTDQSNSISEAQGRFNLTMPTEIMMALKAEAIYSPYPQNSKAICDNKS